MSGVDDGGPSFPVKKVDSYGDDVSSDGMSLRDWFAGMALQGLCARIGVHLSNAGYAYELADAMLQVREVPNA